MKLIVLAVILSCCLVHVYSDCSAAQVSTVQQQFTSTFNSQARLREFAAAVQQRSVSATPTIYTELHFNENTHNVNSVATRGAHKFQQ